MTAHPEPSATVRLAEEPDFSLGALQVSPSMCRVRFAGGERRLEPRVMEVLVVFARGANATISRDQLIAACWGGRVVSDDAVTRAVAKVREIARVVDPPAFKLETVPKVGFRLLTPDGSSLGAAQGDLDDPGHAAPPAAKSVGRRRAAIAATMLLIAALATWASWQWLATRVENRAGQTGRVEVIRFEATPADPDLVRLSSAVGEAMVRLLSATGVETAPRPVARDDGGAAEGAEFRVVGSVRRDGDAYLVNAQILDRRTGVVVWSGASRRRTSALAGFDEQAAQDLVGFMRCAFKDRETSEKPMDTAVFGALLAACDAALRGDHARMLDVTRRLVARAPHLAAGHAMHGLAASAMANRTSSPSEVDALRTEARAAAKLALDIDPTTAKAHLALAQSYSRGGDWAVRERHFRSALKHDPELLPARAIYSNLFLPEVGRLDAALELNRSALASDPVAAGNLPNIAHLTAVRGDLAGAHALVDSFERLDASAARAMRFYFAAMWDDPAVALGRVRSLGPTVASEATIVCLEAFLKRLVGNAPSGLRGLPNACARTPIDWQVRLLARQGDIDGAYALTSKTETLPADFTTYLFYPEMEAFRGDPRFMPLADRLGLRAYWLESGSWPDFCAERDLPYDCRTLRPR